MLWLSDCGLIHKLSRVVKPGLPLKAYEDLEAFKLFILDVGLLSSMVRLDQSVLLDGNRLFSEFKGALTEQYVMQQLKTNKNLDAYYWTNDCGSAEIDFILDTGTDVLPLEVKATINLQSKSLKAYDEKFRPSHSIRTAMTDYKWENRLLNLPLWAVESLEEVLKYRKA